MGFYWKYFWSLVRHKWLVFREWCKFSVGNQILLWKFHFPIKIRFSFLRFSIVLILQALLHDMSKFRPKAFVSYARYWRKPPEKRTLKDIEAYKESWQSHIKNNKHHWEYWVDESSGIAKEMPPRYVFELFWDWTAASKYPDGLPNLTFYKKKRATMTLHPETRAGMRNSFLIESLLKEAREKARPNTPTK